MTSVANTSRGTHRGGMTSMLPSTDPMAWAFDEIRRLQGLQERVSMLERVVEGLVKIIGMQIELNERRGVLLHTITMEQTWPHNDHS